MHLLTVTLRQSLGGQFLRGYVERYNRPPVRNLITFGSQHMGVADLPGCKPTDFLCKAARSAARAGVYTNWAQHNLVQVCANNGINSEYFIQPFNHPSIQPSNQPSPFIHSFIHSAISEAASPALRQRGLSILHINIVNTFSVPFTTDTHSFIHRSMLIIDSLL